MDEPITSQLSQLDASDLLAVVGRAITELIHPRHQLLTERDQLSLLREALRVEAQLDAWMRQTAARLDATEAAWHEHGTSAATWLADVANLTRREAAALIKTGQEQDRFPIVGQAALTGRVLPAQASAITSVLDNLPPEFPTDVVDHAQHLMVDFAHTHNSAENYAGSPDACSKSSPPTPPNNSKPPGSTARNAPRSATGTWCSLPTTMAPSSSRAACRWSPPSR